MTNEKKRRLFEICERSSELDSETGYYYYGARYYNPRVSLWLNVDPLADYNPFYNSEHYIDGQHNGGVYKAGNLNPYIYCYQSPVRYIDPNGKQVDVVKLRRLITNTTAALQGSTDAMMQSTTLGITDLIGTSENSSNWSGSALISYYAERAITDIAMIAVGVNSTKTNGALALATSESIVGGVGFGLAALYSGGLTTAAAIDLKQTLRILMSLGGNSNLSERTYEPNPKHGTTNKGNSNKAPTNPQESLDNSFQVSPNSSRRVGYDPKIGEFNVFDEHTPGKFHGHSHTWKELSQEMKNIFIKNKITNVKGKPLK